MDDQKKEIMKKIIQELHQGLSVEQAKEKFEKEIGSITSTEIAEIEQSLINEGLSPDEIKKFCNVHALLFRSTLEKEISTKEESPAHPVSLFKLENRGIEKITQELKNIIKDADRLEIINAKEKIKDLLIRLKEIDTHYVRKEQLLFPFLEKYGFFGPTKVMWGKDDEVRKFLKSCLSEIENVESKDGLINFITSHLNPLIEEVEGIDLQRGKYFIPNIS
jgi:DUF438 domain-containing protein